MDQIDETIRHLKDAKAKKWRDENPDKVKEINKRYCIKKAKQELKKKGE